MEKLTVLEAIKRLSIACDSAQTKDGAGFSKPDSFLNEFSLYETLTDLQQQEFLPVLQKYRNTQLGGAEIVVSCSGKEEAVIREQQKREFAKDKATKVAMDIQITDSQAVLKFDYQRDLVSDIKDLPNRRFNWDTKAWEVPLVNGNVEPLKKLLDFWGFKYDKEKLQKVKPLSERRLETDGNVIKFVSPFDRGVIETIKLIPGRKYNSTGKTWSVELTTKNLDEFNDFLRIYKATFDVPESVSSIITKLTKEHNSLLKQAEENKKLSKSLSSDFEVRAGLNGTLRPFQKSGVEYIVKNKKTFLGDEMGCISGDAKVTFDCFGKIKLRDAYEKFKQGRSEVSTLSLSKYNYGKISLEEAHERFGGKSFYLLPKYKEIFAKFGQKLLLTKYLFDGIDLEDMYSEFGHVSRDMFTTFFTSYLFKRNKVEKIIYKGVKEVVEVILESKKTLKLTPDHEVLTNEGCWVEIGKLSKGSIIASEEEFNVEFEKIISIKEAGKTDVYDIVMADPYRNFIANGIVVHNCGKTITSLAAVYHENSLPNLVVCPNSIKYNWQKEWEKWVSDVKVCVVESKDNPADFIGKYDVYVTNYNTATKYQKEFVKCGLKSLIVDESHYCKSPKSLRSKAISDIKKKSKLDLTILLSGTAITNRPKEIINQLNLIDRLEYFGGFWDFAKRYCKAHRTRFGLDMNGSDNLGELHTKLREVCYIRRNKEDVLTELPDKTVQTIEVDITNRREYKKAENDLIDYLRNEISINNDFLQSISHLSDEEIKEAKRDWHEEKANKAKQAEHLVRINVLKQLAAKGKIQEAKGFIQDTIDNGDKLVVFAVHKEIVRSIAEEFNCNRIDGSVPAEKRQEYVDDFQNNTETKIIVINIAAGREGLTLTAANKMLFIEQGWTPAEHDQAEARIDRIGQKNATNIYYLLGRDTIDNDIYKLISEKREVTNAVNKGSKAVKGKSIIKEIINNLTK